LRSTAVFTAQLKSGSVSSQEPRLLSFGYGGLPIVSHICSVVTEK